MKISAENQKLYSRLQNVESTIPTREFLTSNVDHQHLKARLTAYDELTGKPKRDPLAWRLKKNAKSKKNLIMARYQSSLATKESLASLPE